jgi:hypothetical protein
MTRLADAHPGTRIRALGIAALVASLLVLLAPAASAAPVHVNCDAGGNLQNKINGAPGGSTILVKGTCEGLFSVGFKSLTIRGNPKATLDGHDAGTTFSVNASGKTVTLVDLVVTNGRTTGKGGGIFVADGTLKLIRTNVRGNEVLGSQYSYGGGICIQGSGSLSLTSSRVTGNRAITEPTAGFAYAYGGGIYAELPVTLTDTTVSNNRARATSNDEFAYAYGGAVYAGALTVSGSTFETNVARSTSHAQFAYAYGGALEVGSLTMTGSTVVGNRGLAISDTYFAYVYGGGVDINGGATLTGSTVKGNFASSTAGDFAVTNGGGISGTGAVTLEHSSANANVAVAAGGAGYGTASGGGIYHSFGNLVLRRSTVGRNSVSGTSSSSTAEGDGGGILSSDSLVVSNSTVASNAASGAATPGTGMTGSAIGGGIDAKDVILTAATVAANTATASGDATATQGGGLSALTLTTKASILAGNHAASGQDCHVSTTTSHGHNLVLHPGGCLPSPAGSDITGQSAKLGRLKPNGGPTQTMAIPATSPAFNAIRRAACPVSFDQRGLHRPQGTRCDIGAYERRVG